MNAALDLHDLTISVDGRPLVHGIDLHVSPGERVALLGASGSGKSLTAAAILGLTPPGFSVSGEVSIFGRTVAAGRMSPTGGVAAVFQDSSLALNPFVPLGRQLAAAARAHADFGRSEARSAVEDVLRSVGIDDPERAMRGFAPELSGGQRQRVCIGLALLCRARLLIADEPTTALDVVTQRQVLDVLRRYAIETDAAVLFITHDLAVASTLCDRAVVLEAGRVIESGSMDELISAPQHAFTRSLVAAARQPERPGMLEAAS